MRQQLIEWLTEDIAPEIKKSGDPAEAILKFAHEKNLSPAQVEALGQLYNTAKTLKFLEKSANRGATFKILDVCAMNDRFLEVKPKQVKSASRNTETEDTAELTSVFGNIISGADETELEKAATEAPTPGLDPQRLEFISKEAKRVRIEMTEQALFDYQEDLREALEKVAFTFRTNPGLDFAVVESDALALNSELAPILEKAAKFLAVRNRLPLVRAKSASTDALVDDSHPVFGQLNDAADILFNIQAAESILKEAGGIAAQASGDATALEEMVAELGQDGGRGGKGGKPKGERQPKAEDPNGVGAPPRASSQPTGTPPPKSEGPRPTGGGTTDDKGFFDPLNSVLDRGATAIGDVVGPLASKALMGQNNADQRTVDRDMADTQQTAMLQTLLATDDVLSEADPDKVVDIFNTVRTSAPSLAGDMNVMRVLLRSAVQHEGVSPFDLKGLLDTELSKQKVDFNQRHMDAHLYRGKDLPGKPVS